MDLVDDARSANPRDDALTRQETPCPTTQSSSLPARPPASARRPPATPRRPDTASCSPRIDALAQELGGAGRALAVPTDVTEWEQQQALAAAALDAFGRIDVAFANAGFGAKRGFLAMLGSWLYCSKHSHCSTFARSKRSSGRYGVPSAKYQRIALDSASARPSSSRRAGTLSAGLRPPSRSSRPERSTRSTSRRSYASPRCANSSRTL
jgi:Enoyl-(Acyl carrier protein) reductase